MKPPSKLAMTAGSRSLLPCVLTVISLPAGLPAASNLKALTVVSPPSQAATNPPPGNAATLKSCCDTAAVGTLMSPPDGAPLASNI
jgi:hypothetical protein